LLSKTLNVERIQYMKICFIGASGHYGYVLESIGSIKDMDVIGIAPGSLGENMDHLALMLEKMGYKPTLYDNYIKMLDDLKPQIAVVNCHFGDHAKVAIKVAERGIHIFLEKPAATNLSDLNELKEAFYASGAELCGMFGSRYNPVFYTAWKCVRSGAIGKIRLMDARKSYKLGTRSDFYKRRSTYGGTIPWVGSHAVDWFHWFSECGFQSVYATHSIKDNRNNGGLEMTAICQFVLEGEIFASASIDYLRPANALTHGDDRIRIAGTEGVIEVRGGKVYLIDNKIKGEQELKTTAPGQIFTDFVKQLRGEGKCLISAEDMFTVTEACLRAVISAVSKFSILLALYSSAVTLAGYTLLSLLFPRT
jgi:predicted dehydrogenase